jgi:3-hydroxy acid dehydrogenase/malonic semialdehyde reductase
MGKLKTIFVTGATSGFGKAIAYTFAEHGWRVIITGRRSDRLVAIENELREKFGSEVLSLCFDVRQRQEAQEAIQRLPHDWKTIDVLINNAGLAAGLSTIQEGHFDDWDLMIDTNLKGLLHVSRMVIPGMIERKLGHIINIGSIAGKKAYLKGNVYCATKAAVDALSEGMRIDLLSHGIKVTLINPGAAETEFSLVRLKGNEDAARKVYEGYDPLQAQDIADVVYFAVTRPEHVVLNDIVMTPKAQANPFYFHKSTT